jgi:probable rRNA maturation factor
MNRSGLLKRPSTRLTVGTKRPVRVAVHARLAAVHAPFVRSKLRRASAMLKSHLREVSFVFVGDRQMSLLHERHMAVSGPTDVLSFPLEFDSRGRSTSGEVYVCVPEARRRARQLGTLVQHELLLYALHGLLHLCGFDDRTDRQYHRMHRMEDLILRRLGVGAVFEPKASS